MFNLKILIIALFVFNLIMISTSETIIGNALLEKNSTQNIRTSRATLQNNSNYFIKFIFIQLHIIFFLRYC